MEDSESREREHEVEEFMALLERIESEKRYKREIEEAHKRDSVKMSQTWLSSFQWEDFNKGNNVHHPFQSQGDEHEGQHQSHGEEHEEQQCGEARESMKRKRESSPSEDNKRSSSKENNNNSNKRVIAAFDLNLEGESDIPSSMGLSL